MQFPRHRSVLVLAASITTLSVGQLTIPPPASAMQERQICIGDPVDRGWIVVDAKWNPTKCADTSATEDNVWVIAPYTDKEPGTTMEICAFQPAPRGWEVVSSRWNPTRCENVQGTEDTVKTIWRLQTGADDSYDPSGPSSPEDPRDVTGIFSDMRQSDVTGDIIGTEIFILYSSGGEDGRYYAMVQFAEGVPEPPELVNVYVRGDSIEFDAHFMGMRMQFRGRVDGRWLEGEFHGPVGRIRLERRSSIWQ